MGQGCAIFSAWYTNQEKAGGLRKSCEFHNRRRSLKAKSRDAPSGKVCVAPQIQQLWSRFTASTCD